MTLLFRNMINSAEVTVSPPWRSPTCLFYAAQEKGFLKKVGLEADTSWSLT